MPRLAFRPDLQPSLWESAERAPNMSVRASAVRHTPRRGKHGTVGAQRGKPSESHPSAFGEGSPIVVLAPPVQPPLTTEPLVWGKWPDRETSLVIEGDVSGARYVFAGEMACGVERPGVLLAPWEQRGEIGRVEQRWVDVRRVRRIVVAGAEGAGKDRGGGKC